MIGIYSLMENNWKTYCLMSSIIYIEEMSKPTKHIQIKRYKDKEYFCTCFHGVRLKMNNPELTDRFFDITKKWENSRMEKFIGASFDKPRKEKNSGQDFFYLSPIWLNSILSTCGKIPNVYSFETAVERLDNLTQYEKISIDGARNLFGMLKTNKVLAAGAFIVSMDFECRGVQAGKVSLCMSVKYFDFLNFMLDIAKKWGWTNLKKLAKVDVSYSRRLGIKASDQYELSITMEGLKEIYSLAGPLADSFKDRCINFNVERSKNYKNLGGKLKSKKTKLKILVALKKSNKPLSSTDLMFVAGVRTDVVLDHLHSLESEGVVFKKRSGKRYLWWFKNVN